MPHSPRARTVLAATGAALALAFALSGCTTLRSIDAHMGQASSGQSAPAEASAPSPTVAASTSLKAVHSPGAVADDEQLQPGQCHARDIDANAGIVLPDPACTPGAYDPAVTQADIRQTICVKGWTKTLRPPASDTGRYKQLALAEYGQQYSRATEYDHLVPLELGGANSVSNLWPEPNASGATGVDNPKDKVENALNAAVCDGRVQLDAARQAIASDWATAEQSLGIAG